MRIYLDEAGGFVIPQTPSTSFSLVLALVVPSCCEANLFFEFLRLRDTWPEQKIEIKGSSLDERQAAQVIDLLARFDVLVDFVAIDMGGQQKDAIHAIKNSQADAMTEHLTQEHHLSVMLEMKTFAQKIRAMADQLFVQAYLTVELVLRIVQIATVYYVQRLPAELGEFAWFIDRKGRKLTDMEELWSFLVLPVSEHRSTKTPFVKLRSSDYSHFDRTYGFQPHDDSMSTHLSWMESTYGVPAGCRVDDAKKIFAGQREFPDSLESLGIQLADMLGSILRRALNDRLGPEGWSDFGRLLVSRHKDTSQFFNFGEGPSHLRGWARTVARELDSKTRDIFVE